MRFLLGGKDNLVKLWDAKSGKELSSLLVQIFNVQIFYVLYIDYIKILAFQKIMRFFILQPWAQKHCSLCKMESKWQLGAHCL